MCIWRLVAYEWAEWGTWYSAIMPGSVEGTSYIALTNAFTGRAPSSNPLKVQFAESRQIIVITHTCDNTSDLVWVSPPVRVSVHFYYTGGKPPQIRDCYCCNRGSIAFIGRRKKQGKEYEAASVLPLTLLRSLPRRMTIDLVALLNIHGSYTCTARLKLRTSHC